MKPQRKAYLYAFAAVACWSTIGSAFKLSLRYLGPQGLLVISSGVATLVLLVILVLRGELGRLRKTTPKELGTSAFLGLLNPFLYYTVLLTAYDILPAQEAGTLNYAWPVILVLLSIPMLRQRIGWMSILAILVSFAGIVVIAYHPVGVPPPRQGTPTPSGYPHPVGVALAVGSAVFWALYWILNVRDPREPVIKLLVNFAFGFLYSVIAAGLTGGFEIRHWEGIAGGIYLGLFEMGITFVLWLNALKFSSTTARVSNIIYLSPFISLVLIHLAVGERILPSTVPD
ncbi:MAG TPA: DMT family transporter [Bacteroidales bacterium]|nr:DMT family transporter [Bacteroidales bacterium]